jgi:hypothetical protein
MSLLELLPQFHLRRRGLFRGRWAQQVVVYPLIYSCMHFVVNYNVISGKPRYAKNYRMTKVWCYECAHGR